MKRVKLKILDVVHTHIDDRSLATIRPFFEYDKSKVIDGQYGKEKYWVKKILVQKNGLFLTGLVPTLEIYCREAKIDISIFGKTERIRPVKSPSGFDFWDDQVKAIRACILKQRGLLYFATGTGKTIIAIGLVSCFDKAKSLILCHTTDILRQTYKKFKAIGYNVEMLGGKKNKDKKNFLSADVGVATIQSFIKLKPSQYCRLYDIVIVDEAHHVGSLSGQYGFVLQRILAPIRIGLTATLYGKTHVYRNLVVNGLLGPVIAELSMIDGIEKKLLAKIKIDLIPVTKNIEISTRYTKYAELYQYGIVKNRLRNKLLVESALETVNQNNTVLIMVRHLAHGREIQNLAKLIGLKSIFVHGSSDSETRDKILELLNKKKIKCVIASSIWNEGIDIPSLNHVINAFADKADIPTIQVPGRGTRTDSGKKNEVKLTDFLDPYKFLAEHTVRRLQIYKEKGIL